MNYSSSKRLLLCLSLLSCAALTSACDEDNREVLNESASRVESDTQPNAQRDTNINTTPTTKTKDDSLKSIYLPKATDGDQTLHQFGPSGGSISGVWQGHDGVYLVGVQAGKVRLWYATRGESMRALPLPEAVNLYSNRLLAVLSIDGQVTAFTTSGASFVLSPNKRTWTTGAPALGEGNVMRTVKQMNGGVYGLIQQRIHSGTRQTLARLSHHTWERTNEHVGAPSTAQLFDMIHVHGDHMLTWSGYGPILKSDDGGQHWTPLEVGEAQLLHQVKLLSYGESLIAVTNDGVWRLTDNLQQATRLHRGVFQSATLDGDILYLGPDERGYVVSMDLSEPTPRASYIAAIDPTLTVQGATLHHHDMGLWVVLPDEGVLALNTDGEYPTWENISPSHQSIQDIVDYKGETIVIDRNGGVFMSSDRKQWRRVYLGRTANDHPRQAQRLGKAGDHLYIQTYQGEVLTAAPHGDGIAIISDADFGGCIDWFEAHHSWVFAAPCARGVIHGGGLYAAQQALHWTDWSAKHRSLPTRQSIQYTISGAPQVTDMSVNATQWWAISKTIGVRRSMDQGQTWQDLTPPSFPRAPYASPPNSTGKAGSLAQPYRFWIERVGDVTMAMNQDALWSSEDQGQTWRETPLGLPKDAVISAVSSTSHLLLIATRNHGIWALAHKQPTPRRITRRWTFGSIQALKASANTITAATSDGVVVLPLP